MGKRGRDLRQQPRERFGIHCIDAHSNRRRRGGA